MPRTKIKWETRYKNALEEFCKIFDDMDDKNKTATRKLIENAAFMSVKLEDLQNDINANGMTTDYKNGVNQYGTKKSPEIEIYLSMIKNYTAVINTLLNLLPNEGQNNEAAKELLNFITEKNAK